MDYQFLVGYYEKLESTASKLNKAEILAELFQKTPTEILPRVVLLVQGTVFPKFTQLELGVATQMVIRAIARSTGFTAEQVGNSFKKTGDLGLTAEELVKKKKQSTLAKKKLTVDHVFDSLQKLPFVTGAGSQDRKLNLLAELIASAKPNEVIYIVRTALGEMRTGAAEGIIRDAIANAFLLTGKKDREKKKELLGAVDYAYNIVSDFGEVAAIAKEKGFDGLKKVRAKLGKPIQVMLGIAAEKIEDVTKEFGKVACEWKYDGLRVQLHRKGNEVWVFTRRLEDVTKQFPDIVEYAKKSLQAHECIVEGEALGINKKTGEPMPFQNLSQRIQRKYDIEKMVKEIPIQVNLFDVVYLDGELLTEKKFEERRKILEKIVKPIPEKFQLAKQIVSDDPKEIEKFYKEALKAKQEGVFLKVLDSPYVFGRHVGGWYKIKPVAETLDLVVIGATWGEGTRAKWLTSYELACREPSSGKFLSCGNMSTGLNEEEYETMTKTLKPLIVSEKGKLIQVRPKIILEVGYQEIQKSPHYESGFGLRFPRFIRVRTDRGPNDADTLARVKSLYESQGRAG